MNKQLLRISLAGGAVAALFLLATAATKSSAAKVTFTKDVAPILYKSCVECHRAGEIAPMSLMSYQETRPWARSIKERVVQGQMPPWSADPKVGHWANDPRLSKTEIDKLEAEGVVKIITSKEIVQAKSGTYKQTPDEATLSGNVAIDRLDGRLEGDYVEIDVERGINRMTSKIKRAQALVRPSKETYSSMKKTTS